ncbi:unnamed protein product [Anisakis simplex]|uniref:Inositol oxygenase n=1 Tax=Anisakis simplex TaxID=6269 RepID=A0A0M3K1V0_ANISI|nr:unnamed protein product [Anisakis simplex]
MAKVDENSQSMPLATSYRKYEVSPTDRIQERVKKHYYNQHRQQTVQFVKNMHYKWLRFTHAEMGVLECMDLLNEFVDDSDPDVDIPNIIHGYQTAEKLRAIHPDKPWLHLVGLIHDLGKVMSVWGEHQWAVTGDTYPVGCMPASSVVYGLESFAGNEDLENPHYNTELGMYKERCGLDHLLMTWGHDEYLYQVLKNHKSTLPEEGLYAIRFHSFYPYHNSGDYQIFQTKKDVRLLPSILELNECDLYSKSDEIPDIESLKEYYQSLVDIYVPGVVKW